jgi:hypothetical protein
MAHIFGTINSTFDLDSIVISGVGSATLAGLVDVSISGVTDSQLLSYDADISKWVAISGTLTTLYAGTVIYDSTLGSDTASFDISSISSSYDRLELYMVGRTDESALFSDLLMTFNNDTTDSDYYSLHHYIDEVPTQAVYAADGRWCFRIAGDTSPVNTRGFAYATILGYADGSISKVCSSRYNIRHGAGSQSGIVDLQWESTNAINRITLAPYTGGKKFKAGTRLQIIGYGEHTVAT